MTPFLGLLLSLSGFLCQGSTQAALDNIDKDFVKDPQKCFDLLVKEIPFIRIKAHNRDEAKYNNIPASDKVPTRFKKDAKRFLDLIFIDSTILSENLRRELTYENKYIQYQATAKKKVRKKDLPTKVTVNYVSVYDVLKYLTGFYRIQKHDILDNKKYEQLLSKDRKKILAEINTHKNKVKKALKEEIDTNGLSKHALTGGLFESLEEATNWKEGVVKGYSQLDKKDYQHVANAIIKHISKAEKVGISMKENQKFEAAFRTLMPKKINKLLNENDGFKLSKKEIKEKGRQVGHVMGVSFFSPQQIMNKEMYKPEDIVVIPEVTVDEEVLDRLKTQTQSAILSSDDEYEDNDITHHFIPIVENDKVVLKEFPEPRKVTLEPDSSMVQKLDNGDVIVNPEGGGTGNVYIILGAGVAATAAAAGGVTLAKYSNNTTPKQTTQAGDEGDELEAEAEEEGGDVVTGGEDMGDNIVEQEQAQVIEP